MFNWLLVLTFIFITFVPTVKAHPGRTASDGCHYCRTNCDSWGVPWNERHCHGGGIDIPPVVPPAQDNVQTPTKTLYIPTYTPIPPSNTPLPTLAKYKETEMDKRKFFKVKSVVDGDTIKVNIRGKTETVRLLGIDTPETVDPRKPVQCFGREASNRMKQLVLGKLVKLIDDGSQGNRDKYGRLLRYVYLENRIFVNATMVKEGYALSYKEYPTKYLNNFNNLEKMARQKLLGLWRKCK